MKNNFLLKRSRIIIDLIIYCFASGLLTWQLIKWSPMLLSQKNISKVIDSALWYQIFCYLFLLIILILFIFVIIAFIKKICSLLFFIKKNITVSDKDITFFNKNGSFIKLDKQFLQISFLLYGVNILFDDSKIKRKYWLSKSFFINTAEYDRFIDLMRNLNK
jgi:hypothetical protein